MSRSITLQPIRNEQMCTRNERCLSQRVRLFRLPWTRGYRGPRCFWEDSRHSTDNTSDWRWKKKKKNKPAEIARTFGDLYHNTPSWTTSPTETSLKQNAICTRVYNSGLKPRTLEGLRYTKFSESRLQRILPFYELFINASLKIEWKVVASKFTSSASFNTDYNNRWNQER